VPLAGTGGRMTIRMTSGVPLLQVYDLPTSLAFYRDLLGFEVVTAAPPGPVTHWVLLRNGAVRLMLNTKYEFDYERPLEPDRTSGRDDFILYVTCEDADAAYSELQARGWTDLEEPATASYGMRQVTVRDPDGFRLCLQHETSR
jgi:catechol 2,3-dioxygenase-like lactoylglutathione lyase family enzyme